MWTLILAAMLGTQRATPTVFLSTASSDGSVRWESRVYESDLRGVPTWDPDGSDSPPLSAAQAIRAAQDTLKAMALTTPLDRWKLDSVTLRPVHADDLWIYVIDFVQVPPPCEPLGSACVGSWISSSIHIVVLPNGRAVTPSLTTPRVGLEVSTGG